MKLAVKWHRTGAIMLLFSIVPAVVAQTIPADQSAGNVSGMISVASRNGSKLKLHQELAWNDLLKTNSSGRLRVGFRDGSFFSVGQASQLKVAKHDEAAQQTALELTYGRVRSQVASITRAGGKFEVRTPTAVAGVIGTDFEVAFLKGVTTVNVFSGAVVVTSLVGTMASVTVGAGQSVTIPSSGEIGTLGPLEASAIDFLPEGGASTEAAKVDSPLSNHSDTSEAGKISTVTDLAAVVGIATTAAVLGATLDSRGNRSTSSIRTTSSPR